MNIAPVSNLNSVYGPRGVEGQSPAMQPPDPPKPNYTDSISLSPAAMDYLKSAGIDADAGGKPS